MLQFFLFLIYPTVASSILRFFVCRTVDGVPYLVADMSQTCISDAYRNFYWIAFGFALLFPVGIPLLFFLRLWRHRSRLEHPSVRAENGFLYDGKKQANLSLGPH